jgi:serine/threonine protein kinase
MPPHPEDWRHVRELFETALALPADHRRSYVARTCGGDDALRRQVELLLDSHERANPFLESPAPGPFESTATGGPSLAGRRIGPYEIVLRIGAGGMGEVYKAHDTKLDRPVALKLLPAHLTGDPDRLRRFHAEARAASSLNHPHILVVHDSGDLAGRPFIVTEFVEGQTLRQRLASGAVPVREALDMATQITSALSAAHARGIVHRDIKPENVMLRPDGYVKVLDFGLAKLLEAPTNIAATADTLAGMVMGTPRYMSPEQARGQTVDARTDIWSLGILVYELVAGRRPFGGWTAADVIAETLRADVPPLDAQVQGVPLALVALVNKALAKDPKDRFDSMREVQKALNIARAELDSGAHRAPASTPPTRLIVLPFRILKPDPDTDFLAFSLPDALAVSLANLESLVVRSSLAAGRVSADADLRTISQEADVDIVLSGTLLRAGDQVRVTAQLVDASTGTLSWSHTAQSPLGDIFRLQDSFVDRIVESLALPLTARERRLLKHDEPANGLAYELFLRANQKLSNWRIWLETEPWTLARDLYLRSLEADPKFAPAWAALGRVYRVAAKWELEGTRENTEHAETALKRALELNPDLAAAITLSAQLDMDMRRAAEALTRLVALGRRRTSDPELFVALCQVCRYCGLLDASIAAHERAERLDSKLKTSSGMHTYFVLGNYQRVVDLVEHHWGGYGYIGLIALANVGREADAIAAARRAEATASTRLRELVVAARTLIEGKAAESVEAIQRAIAGSADVELQFYAARHLAFLREAPLALDCLDGAIAGGYSCYSSLERHPWFDSLRREPRFHDLLERARAGRDTAAAVFSRAGGADILGTLSLD